MLRADKKIICVNEEECHYSCSYYDWEEIIMTLKQEDFICPLCHNDTLVVIKKGMDVPF